MVTKPQQIHPHEVHEKIQQGQTVHLVDVRSEQEFSSGHAAGARLLPLHRFTPEALRQHFPVELDQTVYLICRSGGRSYRACEILLQAGYSHVFNIIGGTLAWQRAGLPMEY